MWIGAGLPPNLNGQVLQVDGPDVDRALRVAVALTDTAPLPAQGRTAQRWDLLAAIAERDLTTARVVEPHLDAVAILAEAAERNSSAVTAGGGRTWGVFAAEGPTVRLDAAEGQQGWELMGTKPWCSLAERVSHALVTAHVQEGRRLFAVALDQPGVQIEPDAWHSRGLADVPSGPVSFDTVLAEPVGETGWYLERPGFGYGGIGVAACWYGGAVAVANAVRQASARREPDQIATWHVGALDLDLHQARLALSFAATQVDTGDAAGAHGSALALRTRTIVAEAAERVLQRAGHALGPAPLTRDLEHARRVADLVVYLRQHHGERDVATLGRRLLDGGEPW
jgi:alkylation response protein AidB-like acyl-CoA dehydrogenase